MGLALESSIVGAQSPYCDEPSSEPLSAESSVARGTHSTRRFLVATNLRAVMEPSDHPGRLAPYFISLRGCHES
jgi:hypothetical protein